MPEPLQTRDSIAFCVPGQLGLKLVPRRESVEVLLIEETKKRWTNFALRRVIVTEP